jgi:quinol monooxygenase YgiN
MYARNVRIKLKPDNVSEFRRLVEQKVLPLLRAQKGFRGEIILVTSRLNEAIAMSFWDNQEHADAYNHVVYLDVLRILSQVVESVPMVENFEVVDSTLRLHEKTSAA